MPQIASAFQIVEENKDLKSIKGKKEVKDNPQTTTSNKPSNPHAALIQN